MPEKAAQEPKHEFAIQRIYVKDLSFESPNLPEVFTYDWKPEVDFDMDINSKKLLANEHEVVLRITVKVKLQDKPAYLAEAAQAGIFTIKGFSTEELEAMLGSFCPNILFPYARETLSDLINRGSFPPLYLAPINFDALYQQKLEKQREKK